jgi:hypothetical protein
VDDTNDLSVFISLYPCSCGLEDGCDSVADCEFGVCACFGVFDCGAASECVEARGEAEAVIILCKGLGWVPKNGESG